MIEEKFLIDANALITPYETFYPFDFAPSFWNQLQPKLILKSVSILDLAKDEVLKGQDELSVWIKNINNLNVCNRRTPQVISKYSEVLNYLQTSALYTDKALREWSRAEVADPWLIAAAVTYGYTIITFEQPVGGLNSKNPCGRPKIPDVGRAFNVKCADLYYFIRQMGFRF